MDLLIVAGVAVVYIAGLVAIAVYRHEQDETSPLRIPPPGEPIPSSSVVHQQRRDSRWTKLAKRQNWASTTQHMDPRRSKITMSWTQGTDTLHITVVLLHGTLEAKAHPCFAIGCLRPAKGLLDNRRLIAQAMEWQGVTSDRRITGNWLAGLPGPQKLEWKPKDVLGGDRGRLHLRLPASPSDLSEIMLGMKALRAALLKARAPAWAGLAHERGWHMDFDSTKTLPILAGSLDGVPFRATLRKNKRAFQTQVTSIAVPELMAEMHLMHIEHGQGESASLNHPIAGSMLHAVSPHTTALKLLVNNPQVFGALMAVVHAYPGSSLTGSRIELLAERDLKLELLTAIEAVVRLSKALERYYAPTSGPEA